jgi:hypothetical protein
MTRTGPTLQLLAAALALAPLLHSCSALEQGLTHGLADGYYRSRTNGGAAQLTYLDVEDDSLTAYAVVRANGVRRIDTSAFTVHRRAPWQGPCGTLTLVEHGLDIDLMYVLLKYRPATAGIPPQLNTDPNGALYVGYRTDHYTMACQVDALGRRQRVVRERSIDVGGFIGIGATAMNSTVTRAPIELEYTGMVLTGGVGVFTSIGQLGFGITGGVDHLLDENGSRWVYQDAPWLGLSIGVNLN